MRIKKNKGIKGIIMILVAVMVLSTVSTTFASQKFTDVPEGHWAEEYIEKVHELGIIEGDEDFATFKPNDEVGYVAGINMISKLLEVDEELANKAIELNEDFLEEMNIEEEYKKGVAIGLSAGIVSKDAIKLILKEERSSKITKVDVCIFLTRAMNLEETAKGKELVVLPFKDFDLIPAKAAAYIEVMIEQEIISKKGSNGQAVAFNPESPVTRAVMAKMLSMGYDYIQENKIEIDIDEDNAEEVEEKEKIESDEDDEIDTEEDENEDKDVGDEEEDTEEDVKEEEESKKVKKLKISGVITGTLNTKNIINVKIREDNGNEELYQANSDAKATLDGERIDILELKEGAVIEAEVTENNVILDIDATSFEDQYIGRVSSVSNVLAPFIIVETEIDGKTQKKAFYGTEDLVVTLDGEKVLITDLEAGDSVDLKTTDEEVVKIIAESKNREFQGNLINVDFDGTPVIQIKDNNEEIYEFKLSDNTAITRNGETIHFIDLKLGDHITITTEYDRIIEVEARVVKTEVSGMLSSILIANTSNITLADNEGNEETYIISNDVNIKVDGKYKSIYDLRLGHKVNLQLEGNVVVDLTAEKVEQESRYIGELIYINKETRVIMIKTGTGENKLINMTVYTRFIDVNGIIRNIDSLEVGDELLVVCRYDGVTTIAKNIVIMEKGNK